MRELHLFAGAGGGILGGMLLGHTCVCAVEIEPYCRKVLLQRQRDGILPLFPIWDDICTFDGKPWKGRVDVICGGFPCQDISAAGKGAGIDGKSSGLWFEMARVIREVGPRYVFVENSPLLTLRGLGRVLRDLASMGYDARWGVLGAVDAGAPHKRERIWILAHAKCLRSKERYAECSEQNCEKTAGNALPRCAVMANPNFSGLEGRNGGFMSKRTGELPSREGRSREAQSTGEWWFTEPDVGRVAHGVAHRVDRLKAIGNGQVSSVAALAWNTLMASSLTPSHD